jgi:phage gp45-like
MHRATPLSSSHRGYVAGGARSVVEKVDDSKLMQEMGGMFQHNESRQGIEAPQNYGFTSVVFDADKDAQGQITDGAECTINFMGGNRSFPVAGPMDDRRHRLYGMEKGDTAMFRGKDDKQQFHMNKDGGHWSAPTDKTLRMALVPASQQQQQGQSKATNGGQQSGDQQGQQKKRGQKPVLDDNKSSKYFVDITDKKSRVSGKRVHSMLTDGKVYCEIHENKNMYCGGEKEKNMFSLVVTLDGPAVNVWGRLDPPDSSPS